MTNEEIENFVHNYISLRLELGKIGYGDKAVRQAMVDTAFYIRALQRERDIDKACKWLKKHNDMCELTSMVSIVDFKKAMEE